MGTERQLVLLETILMPLLQVSAHTETTRESHMSSHPYEPLRARSLRRSSTRSTLESQVFLNSPSLLLSWPTAPSPPPSTAWPSHSPSREQALSASVQPSSHASTQGQRRSTSHRHHGRTTVPSSRTRAWRLKSTDTTTRTP